MNIDNIKADKELVKKLSTIHKSLSAVIDDDYDLDKFSYTEKEVGIMHDYKAINQRSAFNRMKKIKSLIELSDNWEEFKTVYKDDPILKRIGVEFLEGKFEFNNQILTSIKEMPNKNEPQYYFKKGQSVDLDNIKSEDYVRIKNQILPEIEDISKIHLEQKKGLIKAVQEIMDDKTLLYTLPKNSKHPVKIDESSQISLKYGEEMSTMLQKIKKGNFLAQQDSNMIIAELPIAGTKIENGTSVSSLSTLLKINLENHKDYEIVVGSLQNLNTSIQDRILAIRQKALGHERSDNSLRLK
jgi:hypothetical protein